MSNTRLIALVGCALALFAGTPVLAQVPNPDSGFSGRPNVERVLPGRLNNDNQDEEDGPRNRRRERAAAEPTPEQNKAAAQALLTAAGVQCQVTEAVRAGVTTTQQLTYEAACGTGPGFLVVSSTPPQTFNCIELAGQAVVNRETDPQADVGQQCGLPANQNALPVISGYAREAGVTCTVDQAIVFAKSAAGNPIYEVGCADADGYWMEKAATGWVLSPCWDLTLGSDKCRFSTPQESLGAWKSVLAGTSASACDVVQARKVGRDAQSLDVYELKCSAGDGFFARVADDNLAKRVHPCAEAANIGGGCTLTPQPAAAPAASQD